jgi:hypothetical protein
MSRVHAELTVLYDLSGISTPKGYGMEQALQEMKDMMAACDPFERVEQFIESYPRLDEEERSVLWLIAWLDGEPPFGPGRA